MTLEELRIDCHTLYNTWPGPNPHIYVNCALYDEVSKLAKTDEDVCLDCGSIYMKCIEIRLDHAI